MASASSQEPKDFDNTDAFYIPVVPNLTDKTRPMFDTRGRALAPCDRSGCTMRRGHSQMMH